MPADRRLDLPRWERFLAFHRLQLQELCQRYQPELLWFDGDWERDESQWRMQELREQLHAWSPGVVLNSRLGSHGDYATPEQGIPIARPPGAWEFCMTMNDSWGYRPHDENFKSLRQIVRYFTEVIAGGGRLLLNIGPRQDGTIAEVYASRLRGLGSWIRKHSEAVHGSRAGMDPGHFYGPSTVSADGKTVYLFLFDTPIDQISVRGLSNRVKRVRVVGDGRDLSYTRLGGSKLLNGEGVPGVLWIDVPADCIDPQATVIALELDQTMKLYQGEGRIVTFNE